MADSLAMRDHYEYSLNRTLRKGIIQRFVLCLCGSSNASLCVCRGKTGHLLLLLKGGLHVVQLEAELLELRLSFQLKFLATLLGSLSCSLELLYALATHCNLLLKLLHLLPG